MIPNGTKVRYKVKSKHEPEYFTVELTHRENNINYYAVYSPAGVQVYSRQPESEFVILNEAVAAPKCSCATEVIWNKGCICGSIKPYKKNWGW